MDYTINTYLLGRHLEDLAKQGLEDYGKEELYDFAERNHMDYIADYLDCDDSGISALQVVASMLWEETANYNSRRKGVQKAFEEGAQGLPSYFPIPFYNFDIANLCKALGAEGDDEKLVKAYWHTVGMLLCRAHLGDI